jgi:hypothetical protein
MKMQRYKQNTHDFGPNAAFSYGISAFPLTKRFAHRWGTQAAQVQTVYQADVDIHTQHQRPRQPQRTQTQDKLASMGRKLALPTRFALMVAKSCVAVVLNVLAIILMLALFVGTIMQSISVESSPEGCTPGGGKENACYTVQCKGSTDSFDIAQLLVPYRFDVMFNGKNATPKNSLYCAWPVTNTVLRSVLAWFVMINSAVFLFSMRRKWQFVMHVSSWLCLGFAIVAACAMTLDGTCGWVTEDIFCGWVCEADTPGVDVWDVCSEFRPNRQ